MHQTNTKQAPITHQKYIENEHQANILNMAMGRSAVRKFYFFGMKRIGKTLWTIIHHQIYELNDCTKLLKELKKRKKITFTDDGKF